MVDTETDQHTCTCRCTNVHPPARIRVVRCVCACMCVALMWWLFTFLGIATGPSPSVCRELGAEGGRLAECGKRVALTHTHSYTHGVREGTNGLSVYRSSSNSEAAHLGRYVSQWTYRFVTESLFIVFALCITRMLRFGLRTLHFTNGFNNRNIHDCTYSISRARSHG